LWEEPQQHRADLIYMLVAKGACIRDEEAPRMVAHENLLVNIVVGVVGMCAQLERNAG